MNYKFTPENITSLGRDEVFVFGSNLAGNHAGGAARVAHKRFGAIMGQGVGMQGLSYAIPTMQGDVDTIKPYVDDFIKLAREWDQTTFYVTRIGCGIAGFTDEQIAPLFVDALDLYNVRLPKSFVDVLTSGKYAESYLSNLQKHYSSYDMTIDCLLTLDRFNQYKPQDLDKALEDLEERVGQVARNSCMPMKELLYSNYPKDSTPGTVENVKRYLVKIEKCIDHSEPYDVPCMRYIYSVTVELAMLMLELRTWDISETDSSKSSDLFFYNLFSIMTGRWNCGDNSYIYDDIRNAFPIFKSALKKNWQNIFTDNRIDKQKLVAIFSNPEIWADWNAKAKHELAVYRCVSPVLYNICQDKEGNYMHVKHWAFIPCRNYSLPVFVENIGRIHFPNFALKKAFIEGLKSEAK